jgi:hypothetical protein
LAGRKWIETGLGVVPMEYDRHLDVVAHGSPVLRAAIRSLLTDKLAGREMDDLDPAGTGG